MSDPFTHPTLVAECGHTITLDVGRYSSAPTRHERHFLKRLVGPVLDIGCGPGRAAAYLRRRDTPALGLDISGSLIDLARTNGALCVHQSVFDPVPFEGRWNELLLLDGNIGIGGDPAKLIERLRQIVRVGGRAFIEVEPNGPTKQLTVREHVDGTIGDPFAWAVVSLAGLDELIVDSGWRCIHVHTLHVHTPHDSNRHHNDLYDRHLHDRHLHDRHLHDRLIVELEKIT